jgi:hypothetical protein
MTATNAPVGIGYSLSGPAQMIVFGGMAPTPSPSDTARDRRGATPHRQRPGTGHHAAVWTGTEMIVWGVNNDGSPGGRATRRGLWTTNVATSATRMCDRVGRGPR